MKLSIILPVYNVENFIADCLDSLLNQDLDKSEYEIICVDDGSPDNSYIVIEEYQSRNENIRLIRQQHGGVSTARNNGLKEANGKYVWYIDPDDYILPNCLGTIISAMDSFNADVCTFNYKEVAEKILEYIRKDQITGRIPGMLKFAEILHVFCGAGSFIKGSRRIPCPLQPKTSL